MMLGEIGSNIGGNLHVAFAALGAALGVGFLGAKAVEAIGRNPGAFPRILVMAILGAALTEAIVFYMLIF